MQTTLRLTSSAIGRAALLISLSGLGFTIPAAADDISLQDLAGSIATTINPPVIYTAKEFITMDPRKPRVEVIAVQDGKILAVGTRAEVSAAAGKGAQVDPTFNGKVVVAGFVEQHVHPALAALTMNTKVLSIEDWDAIDGFSPAIRDEKTYQSKLAAAIKAHKDKNRSFITWGYHHYFHGPLSRAHLDKLSPTLPVIVWHRSAHEFYLNSAALKKTGIDETYVAALTPNQREQVSFADGHFYEQGALAILAKLAPFLASPEQFRKGLEFTETYYHRNGITLACEPGGFVSKPMQDAINAVYSDNATPFTTASSPTARPSPPATRRIPLH